MRFLIIIIFLITNVLADDVSEMKNIIIHKVPKTYDNVIFLDKKDQKVYIRDFEGKLLILNFWATWCAPCREEMPSLDNLQSNNKLNNLIVFPINIGQEDISKSEAFFKELDIKNLNIYLDTTIALAKKFTLRGVPTTIIFDKEGYEFARILGSIDFSNEEFVNWLKSYN